MSITYNVIDGDTFESIARKKYGTEAEANRIARANPGTSEPLTVGTDLILPDIPDAPQNIQQSTVTNNPNETAILIDGKRFRYWDTIRIVRSIDSFDIVEFGAPFNSESLEFRQTFRPFSYKSVVVTVGGNAVFTGIMVAVNPVIENASKIISVGCYSLPGVLNDCTAPASSFPLEFDNMGLLDIFNELALPFGVGVEFMADQGAPFERVALEPGNAILPFFIDLAKQRNLIITSNERGKMIVWQSTTTGKPVAVLEQGEAPLLSVTPLFSPQGYYSHITGLQNVVIGSEGSQFTVKNPRLTGVTRPFTFSAPDTEGVTIKTAVEAKAGRMFGSLASYSVRVATWRDPSGNLWAPNKSVILSAPDAMVYGNYEFIIRSVSFNQDKSTQTATLNLVIPGSFSGNVPESLPWDE